MLTWSTSRCQGHSGLGTQLGQAPGVLPTPQQALGGWGCVLGQSLPRLLNIPASGSQIWLTALCLVLVFTVTLSVFPAITAMVTSSTSPGKWSECWEAEEGRGDGGRREEEGRRRRKEGPG